MSALAETVRLLGRAHGFTDDELSANREQRVHPAQLARAKSLVGFLAPMIVADLFLFGGLGGAWLFHADLREPISRVDENATIAIAGAGVVLGGLFTIIAVSALRRRKARLKALANGLEVLEGAALTHAIEGSRGVPGRQRLTVAGRSFSVGRDTLALITHGAVYRLYVVGDELLSLEPIISR